MPNTSKASDIDVFLSFASKYQLLYKYLVIPKEVPLFWFYDPIDNKIKIVVIPSGG
jgi:hypothetical protein